MSIQQRPESWQFAIATKTPGRAITYQVAGETPAALGRALAQKLDKKVPGQEIYATVVSQNAEGEYEEHPLTAGELNQINAVIPPQHQIVEPKATTPWIPVTTDPQDHPRDMLATLGHKARERGSV